MCLEDEKTETTLDPTKDFKVAITSTSTESKNIPFDTYLTLSKSDEHQLVQEDKYWSSGFAPEYGNATLHFAAFPFDVTIEYEVVYRVWDGRQ